MSLLISALLGFAIAAAGIVPPILHFVTGPLGPAIGGFFAGMRSRCQFEGAMLIALIMSGLLVVLGAVVMTVARTLVPVPLPESGVSTWLALLVFLYVFLLALIGAWIGGAYARRSEAVPADAAEKRKKNPFLD